MKAPSLSALVRQSRLWLPVAAWLIVVALFSTDVGSQSATEGTLADALRSWWPTLAAWVEGFTWLEFLSFVVRKAAHFIEYGVLAFLLGRALRGGTRMRAATARGAVVGVCVLVASMDEWHQSLVASRTGSLTDAAIDVAGAVAVSVWFYVRDLPPAVPPRGSGGT